MLDFVFEQLSTRVDRVKETVRQARVLPDEDGVHQLRVSIRRLTESMHSLEDWLEPRRAARVRRRLRPVMKAAGATRNLDIARELCLERPDDSSAAVAEALAAARTLAAHELIEELLGLNLDKLRPPCEPNPAVPAPRDLAASLLADLVPRYWRAGGEAMKSDASSADLHRFRLATKQLRYTLELFAPVFARRLTAPLALLRNMQTHLGRVNDCETARGLDAVRADPALVAWLAARRRDERRKFEEAWQSARKRSRTGLLA